jgi:hypothetical protein
VSKQVWMGLAGAIVVALALLGWLAPEPAKDIVRNLPWQIDTAADGSTKVFGITLGQTTLEQAEQALHEEATISLFRSGDTLAVEGYFDEVTLNGLKAKMVLAMQFPDAELTAMYERGVRLSGSPSGKKVTLATDDARRVRQTPVRGITYLPSLQVDEATLIKRFGQPGERLREQGGDTEHLLYPKLGLDIALGGGEHPVLQYVLPKEFARLEQPLREQRPAAQQH